MSSRKTFKVIYNFDLCCDNISAMYNNLTFKRTGLLILVLPLLISCSKQEAPQPSNQNSTSVTINGVAYPIIHINSQSWTAVNYNGPGGITETLTGTFAGTYKYYTYAEANAIQLPAGWHLPTLSDVQFLYSVVGPNYSDWELFNETNAKGLITPLWPYANGDDQFGLNAFPLGYYDSVKDSLVDVYNGPLTGQPSFWTSSTPQQPGQAYAMLFPCIFEGYEKVIGYYDYMPQSDGLSVRFVKDN